MVGPELERMLMSASNNVNASTDLIPGCAAPSTDRLKRRQRVAGFGICSAHCVGPRVRAARRSSLVTAYLLLAANDWRVPTLFFSRLLLCLASLSYGHPNNSSSGGGQAAQRVSQHRQDPSPADEETSGL